MWGVFTMQCNLCGKEDSLTTAIIENIEMSVCNNCAKLGTRIQIPNRLRKKPEIVESEEQIIEGFSSKIKRAREARGMKQEEAAKKLAIKESLIHKMESGNFTPSLRMARRLEKFFGIKLIEASTERETGNYTSKTTNFTIADMMNG